MTFANVTESLKSLPLRRRLPALSIIFLGALVTIGFVRPAAAGPTLLFDAANGAIIYSEEPDTLWYPASLTKLMTVYLVFEAIKAGQLKFDDKITTSPRANKVQPSKIGLPVGGQMTVRTGIDALIVKSANDVAIMFAEKIAGDVPKFAAMMNAKAKRLGMTRTHFVNPNGLHHVDQVTTARDMGRLARALIFHYPEHMKVFAQSSMRFGKKRLRSFNRLLTTFDGADGMKTGFVCASGFNIVSSATRGGQRLVVVVLGEPTAGIRNSRAAGLLQHGFTAGIWKTFFFPATLDSMAYEARGSNGPVNMKRKVKAWVCGYRPNRKNKQQQAAELRKSQLPAATEPTLRSSIAALAFSER